MKNSETKKKFLWFVEKQKQENVLLIEKQICRTDDDEKFILFHSYLLFSYIFYVVHFEKPFVCLSQFSQQQKYYKHFFAIGMFT